jgi:hypothetical protein
MVGDGSKNKQEHNKEEAEKWALGLRLGEEQELK